MHLYEQKIFIILIYFSYNDINMSLYAIEYIE